MPPIAERPLPIEVRQSLVHGQGAFATRTLRAGALIGPYAGRRYAPTDRVARRWDNARTYVFGLSDGTLIDGAQGGNATRHINHSCLPNCVAYEVEDRRGRLGIRIEALRRIAAGEELFLDYRLDVGSDDADAYRCHCSAAACRGTMAEAEAAA